MTTGSSAPPPPSKRREAITVDANGARQGRLEILAAHEPPGTLHEAVSLQLFSTDGALAKPIERPPRGASGRNSASTSSAGKNQGASSTAPQIRYRDLSNMNSTTCCSPWGWTVVSPWIRTLRKWQHMSGCRSTRRSAVVRVRSVPPGPPA